MHVHVVSADGEAKFWIEPRVELALNYRYTKTQLNEIETLIEEHRDELVSAWRFHFSR